MNPLVKNALIRSLDANHTKNLTMAFLELHIAVHILNEQGNNPSVPEPDDCHAADLGNQVPKPLTLYDVKRQVNRALFLIGDFEIRRRK